MGWRRESETMSRDRGKSEMRRGYGKERPRRSADPPSWPEGPDGRRGHQEVSQAVRSGSVSSTVYIPCRPCRLLVTIARHGIPDKHGVSHLGARTASQLVSPRLERRVAPRHRPRIPLCPSPLLRFTHCIFPSPSRLPCALPFPSRCPPPPAAARHLALGVRAQPPR